MRIVLWIGGGIAGLVALAAIIGSAGHRRVEIAECERANAINPTVTVDQCVDLVEKHGDAALRLIAPAMNPD